VAQLTAADLVKAFEADEQAATQKYLKQPLQVTGQVDNVNESQEGVVNIVLSAPGSMAGVNCTMEKAYNARALALQTGDEVTVKGLCNGFSLFDVSLNKCVFVE